MEKTDVMQIRCSPEAKARWTEAAQLMGISLSAWITVQLNDAWRVTVVAKGPRDPLIPAPAHNVITPVITAPIPYQAAMTSPRECSVCGKDYDGDLYTSCPHTHEVNPGAKKR